MLRTIPPAGVRYYPRALPSGSPGGKGRTGASVSLTERDLEALDVLKLDREIAEAASALRRDARSMRSGQLEASAPFLSRRLLTTRTAFQAVSALPANDPLRQPLRRWIYALAEYRIDREAMIRVWHERYVEERVVSEPVRAKLSLARMMSGVLSEPRRSRAWADSFVRASAPLSVAVSVLWERRREVASRMGLSGPDEMEAPGTDAARAARAFLDATSDVMAELVAEGGTTWLELGLGAGAAESFSAHLLPRTILDFFRETDLFRSIELDPGPLPAALAPASFVRALLRVGAAWVDAMAPRDQPFVVAHEPYGLRRRTMGALFGLLPAVPSFARRGLGVDASRVAAHVRALSGVWLVGARLAALRVLLRAPALEGRRALRASYEEEVQRTLLVHVPGDAAGALVRLHTDDIQRFAGLLLGVSLLERLKVEHDEDWYRNPRAVEQLRDDARLSPEPTTTDDALAASGRALAELILRGVG